MKTKLLSCLAFSSILFSGLAIINPELGVASTVRNTQISTSQVTENKLIAEIANLEVEIIQLRTRYIEHSVEVQAAKEKQKSLRQRLFQLKPNSRKALNTAISQTLKAKIAELEAERAKKRIAYSEHSPILVALEENIKSFKKRLAQIQPRNSRTIQ